MSDCRKCADFEWCVKNEDCGLFKAKPETNADQIRNMTDKELARYIFLILADYSCPPRKNMNSCNGVDVPFNVCENCWLEWLKQEVVE